MVGTRIGKSESHYSFRCHELGLAASHSHRQREPAAGPERPEIHHGRLECTVLDGFLLPYVAVPVQLIQSRIPDRVVLQQPGETPAWSLRLRSSRRSARSSISGVTG
jgi:hypothetical protein